MYQSIVSQLIHQSIGQYHIIFLQPNTLPDNCKNKQINYYSMFSIIILASFPKVPKTYLSTNLGHSCSDNAHMQQIISGRGATDVFIPESTLSFRWMCFWDLLVARCTLLSLSSRRVPCTYVCIKKIFGPF